MYLPPCFSMRYVSSLYGKNYEFDNKFKEWQLWTQAYFVLEFNLG